MWRIFLHSASEILCVLSLNSKILASHLKAIAMKITFITTVFLFNRGTKFSDTGLSDLGTGLKELKSLTDMSLNFRYI